MRITMLALAVGLVLGCQGAPRVPERAQLQAYSDEPWARVLAASVRDGLVDYAAIDGAVDDDLQVYLNAVARFGPRSTPEAFPTRADQLAYYLNVYNALMLRKWVQSGARTAGPERAVQWLVWFTTDQWAVDGGSMSMDYLEQRIIRPRYGDSRIHAALVCGAVSCPPLRNEPYRGATLDAQLDDQMRQWLSDPSGDGLRIGEEGRVELSAIFDWYRGDFDDMGGLSGMLERYLDVSDPRKPAALKAAQEKSLRFQGYSWKINLAR